MLVLLDHHLDFAKRFFRRCESFCPLRSLKPGMHFPSFVGVRPDSCSPATPLSPSSTKPQRSNVCSSLTSADSIVPKLHRGSLFPITCATSRDRTPSVRKSLVTLGRTNLRKPPWQRMYPANANDTVTWLS
jgi:hypothetical protein